MKLYNSFLSCGLSFILLARICLEICIFLVYFRIVCHKKKNGEQGESFRSNVH